MARVAFAKSVQRATRIQSVWRGFDARKRTRLKGQFMLREEEILEGAPIFYSFYVILRRTCEDKPKAHQIHANALCVVEV